MKCNEDFPHCEGYEFTSFSARSLGYEMLKKLCLLVAISISTNDTSDRQLYSLIHTMSRNQVLAMETTDRTKRSPRQGDTSIRSTQTAWIILDMSQADSKE